MDGWRSDHQFGHIRCSRCLPLDCSWAGPRKRGPIAPSMERTPQLPTPVKLTTPPLIEQSELVVASMVKVTPRPEVAVAVGV